MRLFADPYRGGRYFVKRGTSDGIQAFVRKSDYIRAKLLTEMADSKSHSDFRRQIKTTSNDTQEN